MKQKWSNQKQAAHKLLKCVEFLLKQNPESHYLNSVYQDRLAKFEECE